MMKVVSFLIPALLLYDSPSPFIMCFTITSKNVAFGSSRGHNTVRMGRAHGGTKLADLVDAYGGGGGDGDGSGSGSDSDPDMRSTEIVGGKSWWDFLSGDDKSGSDYYSSDDSGYRSDKGYRSYTSDSGYSDYSDYIDYNIDSSVSGYDGKKYSDTTPPSSVSESQTSKKEGIVQECPLPKCTSIEPRQLLDWGNEDTQEKAQNEDAIVVLVTQCSLDRLDNLEKQVRAWDGYVSVVIYVNSRNFWDSQEEEIRNAFPDNGKVAVSVIHNGQSSSPFFFSSPTGKDAESDPYPINYLRNAALLQAREQHLRFLQKKPQLSVLLVDVDFVPSSNLHSVLHAKKAKEILQNKVVVIPAFETLVEDDAGYQQRKLPSTLMELRDLSDANKVEGFHISTFPQGHAPTDFAKYWNQVDADAIYTGKEEEEENSFLWKKRYEVQHSEGFEPYIVMAANNVPLYDERFQGYGLNKVSHIASVASAIAQGRLSTLAIARKRFLSIIIPSLSNFTVLPGVFLIAEAHEPSKDRERIYGENKGADAYVLQAKLRTLYTDFCERLERGQAPIISNATLSRYKRFVRENK